MSKQFSHANPNKNRSPRHRAREFALQGIYQWLLNKDEIAKIASHIHLAHGFGKADTDYFDILLGGTLRQLDDLQALFEPMIDRKLSALSPIEHSVILLGAYELKNMLEVPYRVVINEGVELTKSFGGTDGHKYVNGILDKLAADLRAEEVAADKVA